MVKHENRLVRIFRAGLIKHRLCAPIVDPLREHDQRISLEIDGRIRFVRNLKQTADVLHHLLPRFLSAKTVMIGVYPHLLGLLVPEALAVHLAQRLESRRVIQIGDVAAIHDKVHFVPCEQFTRRANAGTALHGLVHVGVGHEPGLPQWLAAVSPPHANERCRADRSRA